MSFYEEIKERYKQNVDEETGLLLKEKRLLDGLIVLLKEIALEQTESGKADLLYTFGSRSDNIYHVRGNRTIREPERTNTKPADGDIIFEASDIYYLFIEVDEKEILMQEIKKAFGPEFDINITIETSSVRSGYLQVSITWPSPREEK